MVTDKKVRIKKDGPNEFHGCLDEILSGLVWMHAWCWSSLAWNWNLL
jgi:hypothetical protein